MNLRNVVCLFIILNITLMLTTELKNRNGHSSNKLSLQKLKKVNNFDSPSNRVFANQTNDNTNLRDISDKVVNTGLRTITNTTAPSKNKTKKSKPLEPSIAKIPIIAVLSAPYDKTNTKKAKIAGELVYWIQSGGGIVYPFSHVINKANLDKLLSNTNGIIIQGTNLDIDLKRDYEIFVANLLKQVKALNDKKIYYPLIAVGSGHELIAAIEGNNTKMVVKVDGAKSLMTKLYFHANPIQKKFKLFSLFDRKDFRYFMKYPTNQIDIVNAIRKMSFKINQYQPTSYYKNAKKERYITSFESTKYPIFAFSFHPERLGITKVPLDKMSYSKNAFSVSQKILNFVIEEGRKSKFTQDIAKIDLNKGLINVVKSHPIAIENGRQAYLFVGDAKVSKKARLNATVINKEEASK